MRVWNGRTKLFSVERKEMSDSDGDLSIRDGDQEDSDDVSMEDEFSDDADSSSGEEGVVYLSSDDDERKLPLLLGGSSRRPKTIQTYVAPPNIRDTVYRCQEFPAGVYINKYGEVCPADPRSGIFQKRKHVEAEDDVYREVRRPAKKGRKNDDDDDDWEGSESESSSDDSDDQESAEEKHSEGEVEWQENATRTMMTDEQKKDVFMRDLQSALERTDAMENHLQKSRQQTTNAQKLNDQLGVYEEEWTKFSKKKAKGIKFRYNPKFVSATPECQLSFAQRVRNEQGEWELKVLHEASMNCTTKQLQCKCNASFNSTVTLYDHLAAKACV